jgi:outer membrane protein assembly factor BamB
LADRLYLLNEKNGQLRLVCLYATDGKLAWIQPLGEVPDKLLVDQGRRIEAVQLAYADGVLLCPTNAGTLFGMDLLLHRPTWAYSYRAQLKKPAEAPVLKIHPEVQLQKLAGRWKLSAPVIAGDKVVFTAPDGDAIYCLNLKDGSPLWQAERRDDLYLAGVFGDKVLLVGKERCRALSLADGKKELWKVETGLPFGLGVASGSSYYLPLKLSEVCKIDLDKGVVSSRTPLPQNAVPGNLLFYEDLVISQTETDIACYRPAKR